MKNSNNNINLTILVIVYISTWIILYFIPRDAYNLGGDQSLLPWLLFIVLFLLLPYVLLNIISKLNWGRKWTEGISMFSSMLAIPFVLFIGVEDSNELKENKRLTQGEIIEVWVPNNKRKRNVHYVRAEYRVNGQIYQTSGKEDQNKLLELRDNVSIIYSSKNPQNSEIENLVDEN